MASMYPSKPAQEAGIPNPSTEAALLHVAARPTRAHSGSDLASRLRLHNSTISRAFQWLSDEGLVTHVGRKSRSKTFKITPDGLTMAGLIQADQQPEVSEQDEIPERNGGRPTRDAVPNPDSEIAELRCMIRELAKAQTALTSPGAMLEPEPEIPGIVALLTTDGRISLTLPDFQELAARFDGKVTLEYV